MIKTLLKKAEHTIRKKRLLKTLLNVVVRKTPSAKQAIKKPATNDRLIKTLFESLSQPPTHPAQRQDRAECQPDFPAPPLRESTQGRYLRLLSAHRRDVHALWWLDG